MTPEQIALVQSSYAHAQDKLPELGAAFYRQLFTAHPEVRELFSTDPEIQQKKFTDELSEIVASVHQLPTFLETARELGARHLDYRTRARHYGAVGDALLAALIEVLGPDATEDTIAAWRLAYNLIAETMQQGAAEAARQRAMRG